MARIYLMHNERFDYLVTKHFGDELTSAEAAELRELLSNSAHLRQQYDLLKAYWKDKQSHNQRDQELFQRVVARIEYTPSKHRSPAYQLIKDRRIWSAAAAILLVVGCWLFFYQQEDMHRFVADRKQQKVVLDDGTEVILNYKSILYYPSSFGADTREVTVSGEAFFRVAKETDRPFIVNTKHATLKVLGTSFNVRTYPDEETTETSLIEGALQVTAIGKGTQPVVLKPSEKLVIPHRNEIQAATSEAPPVQKMKIQFLRPTDLQAVETTWLDDKLVFKDVSFGDLAKRLSRKYDVHIEFRDRQLMKLRFTASFAQESLPEILDALQIATPFQYRMDAKQITIYQ